MPPASISTIKGKTEGKSGLLPKACANGAELKGDNDQPPLPH
jgi:hypothetical protein